MMTLRHNGRIATQDDRRSIVEALVIRGGKFLAVGSDREVMRFRDQGTKLIDLRTLFPEYVVPRPAHAHK